ncbi:MAG: diphthamide biosynthesis protein 3 [Amphiamblys sp. WSBS2006]|nr:MAG: diphthamide biosynthesis protein 3 [Amphiamblys sp. WSBS2006]
MSFYDEIEIEDMVFEKETNTYSYPCPCGDIFQVSLKDLLLGEGIARCFSCPLLIEVIYDRKKLKESFLCPPPEIAQ